MIIFDFVQKRCHKNGLISKSIQSAKNTLQLFPIFLTQNTHFRYLYRLIIIEARKIGSINEEDIQKLYLRQFVIIGMC